ncbi:MAG: aminotransferase class III-fold pyridoxal phosphate-dependent enzyme [Planctomycetota bacterium]
MSDATATGPTEVPDRTMGTYVRAEPLFVRGAGAWLVDDAGERYLDLISGIGASSLGHGHARLGARIAEQAAALGHVSNLYRHAPGEELSRRLTERCRMDAVFFSNSGSEANETALKIARKVQVLRGQPERQSFVALTGGFHGRTTGALAVTAKESYREPFGALLDATFVDPENTAGLCAALGAEPAALILEPIQGEGGVRELSTGFLQAARAACDATGTVLIHDEVQCGSGRTGHFLAGDVYRARPDVVTLAKAAGAGVPFAATLARGEAADALVPGDHGSTYGGGTLACQAALTVLDELDTGLQERVVDLGDALEVGLDALASAHPGPVLQRRGRGLIQGLAMRRHDDAARAVHALAHPAAGPPVLACTASGGVLRLLPPYVLTDEDLAVALSQLDAALVSLNRDQP